MRQLVTDRKTGTFVALSFGVLNENLFPLRENPSITPDIARCFFDDHTLEIGKREGAEGRSFPKRACLGDDRTRFSPNDICGIFAWESFGKQCFHRLVARRMTWRHKGQPPYGLPPDLARKTPFESLIQVQPVLVIGTSLPLTILNHIQCFPENLRRVSLPACFEFAV